MNSKQTDSYHKIHHVVALIPKGKVASYGQVADLAGLPGRARMVSKALKSANDNLPWHRVVNSQLKLSFKTENPLYHEQKQRLLSEGVEFKGYRIASSNHWQPDLITLLHQLTY